MAIYTNYVRRLLLINYRICTYCTMYVVIVLGGMMKEEKKESNFDKKEYDIGYAKKNLKRIPFDVQKEDYEILVQLATDNGEKVQEYIKKAIKERAEKDGKEIFVKKYRKRIDD